MLKKVGAGRGAAAIYTSCVSASFHHRICFGKR